MAVLQFVKHMICFYLKEEKGGSNEYHENPEDFKKASDDEGSNYSKALDHSNTFFEATTHSNWQEDFSTENSRKFKCSYDCDFSTLSIEEYMEHFQTVHLYQNVDPKAICPSNCCPSSSTGCKYQTETSKLQVF